MPTTFNMSDVMISYSRRDKVFVQKLEQALRATGREIWIDWQDIPPTVDFLQEIYAGIEAANTFVFVISPDSAKSEVCGLEVQRAVSFNKRLIPIQYRELNPEEHAKLHPQIAAHNWINIREQDKFEDGFKTLLLALDTDVAHVQTHTKLLVLAREWESENRRGGFLLRGEELKDAENWLTNGVNRQPEPTVLQAEYIAASRKAAARTRQIIGGATTIALIIVSILALFAFQQSVAATSALGVSNQRGTEVAYQNGTAVAALTQVQDRENLRATAQQDAANFLQQANDNATLSGYSAMTATSAQSTAGVAQLEAQNSLATATSALGQAAQAQDQAENVLMTATVAQGQAENNLMTATVAQGQGQQALETAQAAQTQAIDAQSAAKAAQTQAAQQQAAAQTSQAQANSAQTQAANANVTAIAAQTAASVALTNAARSQATANAAGTQAANALSTANSAQADAAQQQTIAANAQTEAAVAQATADAANTQAAIAEATAEAETARALSLRLVSEAREVLLQNNRPLAIKLAMLAVLAVDKPPSESLKILWEIASSTGERYTLSDLGGKVSAVGMSEDSSQVYAAIDHNNKTTAYQWNLDVLMPSTPLPFNLDSLARVAFSPDGKVALTNGSNAPYTFSPWQLLPSVTQTPDTFNLSSLENRSPVGGHLMLLQDNQTFVIGLQGSGDSNAQINLYSMVSPNAFIGNISSDNKKIIYSFSSTRSYTYVLYTDTELKDPQIMRSNIVWSDANQSGSIEEPGVKSQTIIDTQLSGWKYAAFGPDNSDYLLVIEKQGVSINPRLLFLKYSLNTEDPNKPPQLMQDKVEVIGLPDDGVPSVIAFRSQYPSSGAAAAVVGQENGQVTILDLPSSDKPDTTSVNKLVEWVCKNRYLQTGIDATNNPYGVTGAMLDRLAKLKEESCDITQAPLLKTNTLSLFEGVPMTPVVTPTPEIALTPTETPTLDPNLPQVIDASDPQVSQQGSWQPIENVQAKGGSYLISGNADDSMSLTFEGTAISVIYFQHPAMGSFNLELDGTLLGSVRETGDNVVFRQVPISGLVAGTHTLRFIVAQNPVVVDAFVVNPPIDWLPASIVTTTPSPTFEITLTPTATWTAGSTPELSLTPSSTATDLLPTTIPIATLNDTTETPTPTLDDQPTVLPTASLTASFTPTPTDMPPTVEINTATPTDLPSATPTETLTLAPTETPIPTLDSTADVANTG